MRPPSCSPSANGTAWLNWPWPAGSTHAQSGVANISDTEAFAATTLALGVGVVELEALVEALLDEVQLGTIQVDQALGIDDDLDTVLLEYLIFIRQLVDKFEHVGKTGTAGGLDAEAQADALATVGQKEETRAAAASVMVMAILRS